MTMPDIASNQAPDLAIRNLTSADLKAQMLVLGCSCLRRVPCRGKSRLKPLSLVLTLGSFTLLFSAPIFGQISFGTAARLAAVNSPRVKMAQDDVNRTRAVVAENRNLYVPSLNAQGGVGRNYGITLTVPTIFTLTTQSLLFSQAQRDYSHAARESFNAAELTLNDVRMQVEEDTALTWVSLDSAERRHQALRQLNELADRLQVVVAKRETAGLESELDAERAHRMALQARLSALYVEDEMGDLRQHLANLLSMKPTEVVLQADTLPGDNSFADAADDVKKSSTSSAVLAAQSNSRSRLETAFGDRRNIKRPQFYFQAQYGRISPINNVSDYYNLHGRYNVFEAGVSINFPIIDQFRQAKARESMADALHAQHELERLSDAEDEDRLRLAHTGLELATKAELAEVDYGIARGQMKAMQMQAHSPDGAGPGHPPTPEDALNAQIEERNRYIDLLNVQLQLRKTRVSLMRLNGTLEGWIASLDAAGHS